MLLRALVLFGAWILSILTSILFNQVVWHFLKKIKLQFVNNMSDVEENEPMEAVAYCAKKVAEAIEIEEAVATVLGPAPADDLGGRMYFATVLREALRSGLIKDGLSRGLHETTKVLEKRQALLCIEVELPENYDDSAYKKHVQALCQEHQIPLLTVPDNAHLGKYSGFCQRDGGGNKRKVNQCTYVAVKDWGKTGLTISSFGIGSIFDFLGDVPQARNSG